MSKLIQSAICVLIAFALCCVVLFLWWKQSWDNMAIEIKARQEAIATEIQKEKELEVDPSDSDKAAALWQFALTSYTKTETKLTETGFPVVLVWDVAKTPYAWSTAIAKRTHGDGTDPKTIDVEIATFVNAFPWFPVKDVGYEPFYKMKNGSTDLIEWECESQDSDLSSERIIRFRLLAP